MPSRSEIDMTIQISSFRPLANESVTGSDLNSNLSATFKSFTAVGSRHVKHIAPMQFPKDFWEIIVFVSQLVVKLDKCYER